MRELHPEQAAAVGSIAPLREDRPSPLGHLVRYRVPMNDELRAVLRDLPSRLRSERVFPLETGTTALDAKNYMHRVFVPAVNAHLSPAHRPDAV